MVGLDLELASRVVGPTRPATAAPAPHVVHRAGFSARVQMWWAFTGFPFLTPAHTVPGSAPSPATPSSKLRPATLSVRI